MRGAPLVCLLLLAWAFPSSAAGQRAATTRLAEATRTTGFRFTRVVGVIPLSDSALLVADAVEEGLIRVRWSDRSEVQIGRRGEGPGEIKAVGPIWPLGGDSVFLVDSFTRSWTVVTGDSIIRVRAPEAARTRVSALRGVSRAGFVLSNQRLDGAAERTLVRHSLRGDPFEIVVGLASAESGARLRTRLPSGAIGVIGGNPLDTFEDGVLFPDGAIAVVRLDPYRVDWLSADGVWTRGAPLPFERIRVTRRVRCAVQERFLGFDCRAVDLEGWPQVVPPLVPASRSGSPVPTVLPADEGRLAILRTPEVEPERRVDIVDRRGSLACVLELPAGVELLGFGPSVVYVLSTNSLGLQEVREHSWPTEDAAC